MTEQGAASNGYVFIDLGKKRKKDVRQLRKGGGKLVQTIDETLEELRNAGTIGASAQTVVVVVRQKSRPRFWA